MSIVNKHSYNVGGLEVNVFSKADLLTTPFQEPVAVLIVLHGRTGSSGDFEETARTAFQWADEKKTAQPEQTQRDFIVVTFDQRNHGSRTVEKLGNLSWAKVPEEHNKTHAVDMYSIQTGTARDVSFVIDFLPAYVFPNDERTVAEWVVAGISLGGHSTWLTLKNEPRVRVGIPIIGCPDYLALIGFRAKSSGVPLAPPFMPASLRARIQADDPVANAFRSLEPGENPFLGKRILVLSGEADTLVPWIASKEFVEGLEVGDGKKKVMVMSGVGHEYTKTMMLELFQFFWEEALLARSKI
ncbi:alpha/beta-hydrolase [Artomyces pyxidatus]|uniref:Alpha/beta-hydrolase n=1 Tax=Artomyces pyxidatus TaxID=48021 RepID=A0ACB8SRX7_9AGAM|nr:alpha/beta-hydrolase [Artomyces pyxidatus]